MLQIVKLEHANREYTGRRTEIAPSFTASVGLAQARPNDITYVNEAVVLKKL